MGKRTVANAPKLAPSGVGLSITTLKNVTVDAVTCRARPVPCAADVGGITVVTGDQRMIATLLVALASKKKVDVEYGERLEYYETPPDTYSGLLLRRITVK